MWVLNYDEKKNKIPFLLNENNFYLDFGSSVDKKIFFVFCCSFGEIQENFY